LNLKYNNNSISTGVEETEEGIQINNVPKTNSESNSQNDDIYSLPPQIPKDKDKDFEDGAKRKTNQIKIIKHKHQVFTQLSSSDFDIEKDLLTNKRLYKPQIIEACFNKGFQNKIIKIKGNGSYNKCLNYIKANYLSRSLIGVTEVAEVAEREANIELIKNNLKKLGFLIKHTVASHSMEKSLSLPLLLTYSEFTSKIKNICNSPYDVIEKEYKSNTNM